MEGVPGARSRRCASGCWHTSRRRDRAGREPPRRGRLASPRRRTGGRRSKRSSCSSRCSRNPSRDRRPSDGFYDQLCEAVCRLARMRRAVIFRYDSTLRRVRAAGAYGMDLAQFASAHVTVESAPIAARALREDRVVEAEGDLSGQVPEEYSALVSEPARLVCAPMTAGRAADRSDPDRPADVQPAAGRRRPQPAVDARQGRRAGLGGADRRPTSSRPRASSSSGSISRARSTRG